MVILSNDVISNLDLLSVGIAVASTVVLGFSVYFNNRNNVTNRSFLYFTLVTAGWGIVNYLSYQFVSRQLTLWLIRLIMFLAIFQAFFLYQLLKVFPSERFEFSNRYKFLLTPVVLLTAVITLTPLLFRDIVGEVTRGEVAVVSKGPGLLIFGVIAIGLVIGGLYNLIRKTIRAKEQEKRPLIIILLGLFITFLLTIVFNFIIATIFTNPRFIPLGAVFFFPFIAFTAYTILKHKLFNIRVAGTAVLVFLLSVVTFSEVILARDIALIIYRSSIFILVLSFGTLLIRGVLREVEQREKLAELNKKLQLAYDEVDRLSKAKSEFISIASHQLRTPLSAIKGYISMLIEGTYGKLSGRAKRPLENVYLSNERLIDLVNNLLDISRIEAGRMEFEPEESQVEEIIDSVVEELKITAEQKELYLQWEKPKIPLPKVLLDRDKMRQVFLNLIHNAIKYTNQGGITIKFKIQNSKVKIVISDTGKGMTKEDLGKIFETFSRGTIGVQVSAEGAGLGLYIARKFVEMHKGRVWGESEGKSKGSTFYVELPVR